MPVVHYCQKEISLRYVVICVRFSFSDFQYKDIDFFVLCYCLPGEVKCSKLDLFDAITGILGCATSSV